MKTIATLLVALSIALPAVPALAGPGHRDGRGHHHAKQHGKHGPSHHHGHRHEQRGHGSWRHSGPSPRVGHAIPRGARMYHPPHDTRLRPLPRGQEYRVHDGHLMLVDSRTAKIIAVIGLLSMLAS